MGSPRPRLRALLIVLAAGLAPTPIADTECCFAEKVETWVSGPDGSRWEWYVKTGDTESIEMVTLGTRSCCPE